MNNCCIGIYAHVDAGKTTLSEALLYLSGVLRTPGRVDKGSSLLDNFTQERQRGITIFSKQADFRCAERPFTLLDTPGHVDFSPETERTLAVLDAAILVVSGSEGVQSHTLTLWKLLRRRHIPTFIYVNKMDLPGIGEEALLKQLRDSLSPAIFRPDRDSEEAAAEDEEALEELLTDGSLAPSTLKRLVEQGKAFPCRFGSALKLLGVRELLEDLAALAPAFVPRTEEFAAKVYKISRDEAGTRLTHIKLTGGSLKPRDRIVFPLGEEKPLQLRRPFGDKYTLMEKAAPGDILVLTGLSLSHPGQGLGAEEDSDQGLLQPVMHCALKLPEGADPVKVRDQLRLLEEEEPSLSLSWNEEKQELCLSSMGSVQQEVLQAEALSRFGLAIDFGPGLVLYRETLKAPVEGVGHFEPLRHYAEVHLLLEPAPRGSGLSFENAADQNSLAPNWQRLILTHLQEKVHLGVLTGAPLTDVKITLLSGRAHEKHTEGGDFREATYRALRQGLMMGENLLLEPRYRLELTAPADCLGRLLTDLQQMSGEMLSQELTPTECRLSALVPVSGFGDYPKSFSALTRGMGRLSLSFGDYAPCAEAEAVITAADYRPEADLANTPDSVFCAHGAGFAVNWREVPEHMHLPYTLPGMRGRQPGSPEPAPANARGGAPSGISAGLDKELMAIFERTYGKVREDPLRFLARGGMAPSKPYRGREQQTEQQMLLVDGYNLLFAWEGLREKAREDLEAARQELCLRLQNYQAYRGVILLLIFDAYKVKGNPGSVEKKGDFSLIYTREAETADSYIAKATYDPAEKRRVQVVTSDALEQLIILGHGALRLPAGDFARQVEEAELELLDQLESLRPVKGPGSPLPLPGLPLTSNPESTIMTTSGSAAQALPESR